MLAAFAMRAGIASEIIGVVRSPRSPPSLVAQVKQYW